MLFRSFRRLADIGVEVAGIYGGFFAVPEGFARGEAEAQAERFCHLLANHAEAHGIVVALEAFSDLTTLFPRYLDSIAFAKRVDRPSIKVMADLNYFLKLDQPLEEPWRGWCLSQYYTRRVVRNQRFKLYSSGEFYDLSEDPLELHDLQAIARQAQEGDLREGIEELNAVLESLPEDAELPFEFRSISARRIRAEEERRAREEM